MWIIVSSPSENFFTVEIKDGQKSVNEPKSFLIRALLVAITFTPLIFAVTGSLSTPGLMKIHSVLG